MIHPGKLDQRVAWQAPTPATEGHYGQEKTHYPAVYERWAKVEEGVSGRHLWYAQQPQRMATHVMTLRDIPELRADWRAEWRGRTFAIEHIQRPGPRSDDLIVFCVEQQGGS